MIDKNKIMEILGTVKDPELNKSLTDLDMIKSVDIDGGKVKIEVSLTIAGCPLKKKISEDVSAAVSALDGVDEVEVKLGTMTDEQRKNLVKRIYGKDHRAEAAGKGKEAAVAGDFADRVICIASGKGGVGKSTVTSNLAAALTKLGHKVGVLDADVYGFSIPRIFGVSGQPTAIDNHIVPIRKNDIQIISIGFFVDENT
ncbi:MAG TPA: DUF59 domain-containing protein, partial [candidate division Zixibacteria bacterium]|nr:DUF59 domain-containing protein [candidate division Zixibacteria bacterium]